MCQITNREVTNQKVANSPRQVMARPNLYRVWESVHINGKDQLICKWLDASQSIPEPTIQETDHWLEVTVATCAVAENAYPQDEPEPSDFVLHLYG